MPHQCTGCGHVFPDGSKEMLSGCPECGGNKFQFQPSGATDGAEGADAEGTATPPPADEEPPEPPESPSPGGSVAETVASATQRVKNVVGSGDDGTAAGGGTGAGAAPDDAATGDHEWPAVGRENAETAGPAEDSAQASARSGTVSPEELPDRPTPDDAGFPDEPPTREESASSGASSAPEPAAAAGDAAEAGASEAADAPGSAPFTGSGDREESDDSPDLSELRAELNDQFESIKIVERGQYELNLMELYDREEYIISLMEDGRYAIEVPETWRGEN